MPWSCGAKRQAVLLVAVVVPLLMFGLAVLGFYLAKAAGLGDVSAWVALLLATVGLVVSIILTLRVGRAYERPPA